MKNTGFFARITALLCMMALLCGLAGCGMLQDILGGGETEPTQDGGQVQFVTAEPMQVYDSPDPAAQIVGIVPENTQIVIVQTVRGFTADGADAVWGKLLYEVGWVILRTEGEPPSVDPDLTPTQPQEPTLYNTKLLPQSASRSYMKNEILLSLQPWLEAGYSYAEVLSFARNEIFANHGYRFSDSAYTRYFYEERAELYGDAGTLSAQQAQALLSDHEQNNVATLQEMEAKCAPADPDKVYWQKLLPESAQKRYTKQEVLLSLLPWLQDGYYLQEALMLARNEIFANYGFLFSDNGLRYYFNYAHRHLYPQSGAGAEVSSLLSSAEIDNVQMLQDWQRQCAEPAAPSHPTPDYRWPITEGNALVVDLDHPDIASDRYHIPYVTEGGFEAVNQKIQADLLPMACEVGWDDIGYTSGQSGDVVSILVCCEGYSDDSSYYTYHFDRTTGELLERVDVLRQFGLNTQTFLKLAEERALDYFESSYRWMLEESDQTRSMYEELREITREYTLDNTLVFIGRNGNLGFIARIGAVAGAAYDNKVLSCWEDAPVEGVTFPQ